MQDEVGAGVPSEWRAGPKGRGKAHWWILATMAGLCLHKPFVVQFMDLDTEGWEVEGGNAKAQPAVLSDLERWLFSNRPDPKAVLELVRKEGLETVQDLKHSFWPGSEPAEVPAQSLAFEQLQSNQCSRDHQAGSESSRCSRLLRPAEHKRSS